MDINTFRQQFLEFREVDPPVIEAALARATRFVDPVVWGAQVDDGIAMWAAHLVQLAVYGGNTKLMPRDGRTTYWLQFEEMRAAVVFPAGLSGGSGVPRCGPGPWGSWGGW